MSQLPLSDAMVAARAKFCDAELKKHSLFLELIGNSFVVTNNDSSKNNFVHIGMDTVDEVCAFIEGLRAAEKLKLKGDRK